MPMVMRISFDIETQDDVHAALSRLHALLGAEPAPAAVKEVAVEKPKKVKKETPPAPAADTTLTAHDLGKHFRTICLEKGDTAQQAIGEIILKISGTQALSQVDPALYGNIKLAVDNWVREHSGMNNQVQKPSDIAVLEQRYGDVWRVLTYIGPDRKPMVFLPKTVLKGGSMKVRYLGDE